MTRRFAAFLILAAYGAGAQEDAPIEDPFESAAEAGREPDAPPPAPEPPPVPRPPRPTETAPLPLEPAPRPASAPASEGNRLAYVGTQTLLSTYLYGLSFPLAYGVREPRVLIATPLIVAPVAFGAHLWISRGLPFADSHLRGTLYYSTLAAYAATALPLAFNENFVDGYKLGSILGAVAYPAGIWYGYHLGNVHRDNPARLDAKLRFALMYAFLGFVTPVLYFEHPGERSEDILRIGLAQSVGLATLGQFVADFHRVGPAVPSGVSLGLATHAVLGGLAGLQVAAMANASSPRPWIGAAVLGTSLGYTEGVFFFHRSRDSRERALYGLLGGLAGAAMGTGLNLLLLDEQADDYDRKVAWSSYVVGGTWLGYWATYLLTAGMADAGSSRSEETAPIRWALNPFPEMEAEKRDGQLHWRWRFRGISYHF